MSSSENRTWADFVKTWLDGGELGSVKGLGLRKTKKAMSHSFTHYDTLQLGLTLRELGASLVQASKRLELAEVEAAKVQKLYVLHQALHNLFTGVWEIRESIQTAVDEREGIDDADVEQDKIVLEGYKQMLKSLDPNTVQYEEIQGMANAILDRLRVAEEDGIPHWSDTLIPTDFQKVTSFAAEHEQLNILAAIYVDELQHHQKERDVALQRVLRELDQQGIEYLWQLLELDQRQVYQAIGTPLEEPLFYAFLESFGYSWKYRGKSQMKYPSHRYDFSEKCLRRKSGNGVIAKVKKPDEGEINVKDQVAFVMKHMRNEVNVATAKGTVDEAWLKVLFGILWNQRVLPQHIVVDEELRGPAKYYTNAAAAVWGLIYGDATTVWQEAPYTLESMEYGEHRLELRKVRYWTDAFIDSHYIQNLIKRGATDQPFLEEANAGNFLFSCCLAVWEWYADVEISCGFQTYTLEEKLDGLKLKSGTWHKWDLKGLGKPLMWTVDTEDWGKIAPAQISRISFRDLCDKTHTPSEQSD